MNTVLVLNSGYVPVNIIGYQDAISLLYQNRAYSVVETEKIVRSPSLTFKVPSVIALTTYHGVPNRVVRFSRINVIYRDDMTCMYCGRQLPMNQLTVDHIIPKSKWIHTGRKKEEVDSFLNCVCSCKSCNTKKDSKSVKKAGMKLLREPFIPKYLPKIVVTFSKASSKGWLPFCKVNVKVIYTT